MAVPVRCGSLAGGVGPLVPQTFPDVGSARGGLAALAAAGQAPRHRAAWAWQGVCALVFGGDLPVLREGVDFCQLFLVSWRRW